MFVCKCLPPPGVKNIFQTKDMKYGNVSTHMEPGHYAMVPQLVEKQLHTEQVPSSPSVSFALSSGFHNVGNSALYGATKGSCFGATFGDCQCKCHLFCAEKHFFFLLEKFSVKYFI